MNWLERARRKFEETPQSGTANTADRNLTAVTAVRSQGIFEKTGGANLEKTPDTVLPILPIESVEVSNGSNGSTLLGPNAETARSRWWRLRMADGSTKEIASFPAVTRDELLRDHPEAVGAEPFDPGARPAAALTDGEEKAILAWCQAIEEDDPEVISTILEHCRRDAEAKAYYLGQAAEASRGLEASGLDQLLGVFKPIDPGDRPSITPLTDDEEQAITGWLKAIGATDGEIVGKVMDCARCYLDAREHYLGRAAALGWIVR